MFLEGERNRYIARSHWVVHWLASCNYKGINNVYDHYAQAKMNRRKFHYNLEQILHATTPTAYAHTFGEMKVYIMSNDSKDQMTWLDW